MQGSKNLGDAVSQSLTTRKKGYKGQALWCTPEILALRKLRLKNIESKLAWAYFTI